MKTKRSFILSIFLLGCLLLTGCDKKAESPLLSCNQINNAYQFKQIFMSDIRKGWALTPENEVLFTDSGTDDFVSVRKIEDINIKANSSANACFVNDHTAYLSYFSADEKQIVIDCTHDGGKNWVQSFISCEDYDNICDAGSVYLSFYDDENGYLLYCSTPAAGMMTKLLFRTDDAGKSFSLAADLTDEMTGYPQGISFRNDANGYIAVSYHGQDNYLYRTGDGGSIWTSEKLHSESDEFSYIDGYAPVFYGEDMEKGMLILKAVAEENTEYKLFTTADRGDTWNDEGKLSCDSVTGYSVTNNGQLYLIDNSGNLFELLQ